MNEKELQAKFEKAMSDAEAIRLKYDGKPGDMEAVDRDTWQKAIDDADGYKVMLEAARKEAALKSWSAKANDMITPVTSLSTASKEEEEIARKAFTKFLTQGPASLKMDERSVLEKAYQADSMVGGGFVVTPQEFAQEFLTLQKDLCFVRAAATLFPLDKAESLGVGALDTDPSDSDWTTELATGSEESTAAYGKRELKPWPMAKLLKLSKKLLRQSAIDAEALILDRLAYKASITEEKAFLTGDGGQKPLGMFTASANGVSTGRDVACASQTVIAADDLIKCQFGLKAQYRARGAWLINRTVLQNCRLLKDSNNNYIWATGLGPGTGFQGTPSTLLGAPVMESEYAPNTQTTGLYVAMFADYSKYFIADALNMELQVLDQLYAATNQMGYILRKETDGMPVLEEAFSRLKMA